MCSAIGFSDEILAALLPVAIRMATRWCASADDAQDIAQDAMLRLMRQNRPPENVAAWLFVVTRRLSHLRWQRERTRAEAEAAFAMSGLPDLHLEVRIHADSVLSQLTPKERALLLFVVEGWRTNDIASAFGCSPGNIGTMVARARTRAKAISTGKPRRKHSSRKR